MTNFICNTIQNYLCQPQDTALLASPEFRESGWSILRGVIDYYCYNMRDEEKKQLILDLHRSNSDREFFEILISTIIEQGRRNYTMDPTNWED